MLRVPARGAAPKLQDLYTAPHRFGGAAVKVVLQCRQREGFGTTHETIGWRR